MAHKKDFNSDYGSLPMELLMMIFINLPVKCLVRFTCVCKSWLRLIRNDVQFAITHYVSRSTSSACLMGNFDYIGLYFTTCWRKHDGAPEELCVYYFSAFSLTEEKTFRKVKKFELELGLDSVGVSSNFCHGIKCIQVIPKHNRKSSKLMLWNPSIREVVEVPVSLNIHSHRWTSFGIGYDSICNDYKIVAITRVAVYWNRTWVVDIFSISNGRWCSLHGIDILQQYHSELLCPPVLNSNSSTLNWNCGNFILSFDVVDEKFCEIPMPNCLCHQKGNEHSLLTACHVKACLCCYSYHCNEDMNIWVLTCLNAGDKSRVGNDPGYSWVKQVSIRFPDQKLVYPTFWMNDNELLLNVENDKDLFEVCSYDLRTRQLKGTGYRRTNRGWALSYTESLVSIKSLMQHTTNSLL